MSVYIRCVRSVSGCGWWGVGEGGFSLCGFSGKKSTEGGKGARLKQSACDLNSRGMNLKGSMMVRRMARRSKRIEKCSWW